MAWHDDAAAIAILPQAVGATDTASLAAMQALQATYQEQGIEFFLLNPGLQTDRAAVAADIGSVDMQVLMDDAQLVSEMLGLTRLDEAVLYNPNKNTITIKIIRWIYTAYGLCICNRTYSNQ